VLRGRHARPGPDGRSTYALRRSDLSLVVPRSCTRYRRACTRSAAACVIGVKRTSVVFAVVFGGFFFGERDVARRLAGAGLMLVGVLLITLG